MMRWMRRAAVVVAAVGAVAAAGTVAPNADAHPHGIVVTFEKHVVDPTNFVFEGTTGGRVKGELESRMVPGTLSIDGAIWTFTFDWIVTARAHRKSFVARTTGTFDTSTGAVVMDGTVTRGWHKGARVHEEGRLTDAATFTFAGRIVIFPDC